MAEKDRDEIELLPVEPDRGEERVRRDQRLSTVLPLRLTSGSGDVMPAVVLNVSASGVLALVDGRFSPILPPPCGTRLDADFFLEEVDATGTSLEVVRTEERGRNLVALGCRFVDTSPEIPRAIREKIITLLSGAPGSGRSASARR